MLSLKGTRQIGCELGGPEGSEGARRHVGKVLMAQKKEAIAKEVKCCGGIWQGIQSTCKRVGLL